MFLNYTPPRWVDFQSLTNNQVGPLTLYGDPNKTNSWTYSNAGVLTSNANGTVNINGSGIAVIGGTYNGNGSGLTNLNTASLTGTIADARLSTNVALLNANQTFTGSNVFSGVVTAINPANTFNGAFTGSGGGLINLSANAIIGGLTTNLAVLVPGGGTNTLCITNGVLRAIQ
jgi:hypothetical protein